MRLTGSTALVRSLTRNLLALLALAPLAVAQGSDSYQKALERYKETIQRLPLPVIAK